ncbi:translin-associated protein X-like [Rhipicephalus microplus]|uniref:translin-associated protein X-like n=1 Tax=Rhipicephalus microplus TaxID=6941 RepID=UPI001887899E|nr:LOW QUALITY PROTEIN: translin-associated protein X-like [Rhipicephalus microplus]
MTGDGKNHDKGHHSRGHDRGHNRGGHDRSGHWSSRNRQRRSDEKRNSDVDESLAVVKMFRAFQVELDDRYDRYERLVKLGRDVTIESKRIIFLLHRIMKDDQKDKVLGEADQKLCELSLFSLREIAMELRGQSYYQYLRAFSPGIQEYVEALTFFHYIKDGHLVTLDEIHKNLVYLEQSEAAESEMGDEPAAQAPPGKFSLEIVPLDYMLGIADLTGELMRKCINAVGQGDLEEPFVLCRFLRDMYTGFLGYGNTGGREISRKVWTLFQSVRKVENACYTIKVRGSEVPNHVLADMFYAPLPEKESPDCG